MSLYPPNKEPFIILSSELVWGYSIHVHLQLRDNYRRGVKRLSEPEVDNYNKSAFVGHDSKVSHMNSQLLGLHKPSDLCGDGAQRGTSAPTDGSLLL